MKRWYLWRRRVKCMVEHFGGELRLITRQNEGSTFLVLLLLTEVPADPMETATGHQV